MLNRTILGILYGAAMALLCSGIAAMLYAVGWLTETSADAPAPLVSVVSAYFAAGLPGGAVAGMLWPHTRRVAGAIAVGIAAMTPFYLAGGTLFSGLPHTWTLDDWILTAMLAVTFGIIVGIRIWSLRCGMALNDALTLESLLRDCGCDSPEEDPDQNGLHHRRIH